MISALLFDLDGTLIDTAPDFAEVLNGMRRRRELPDIPFADIHATVSDGARALVELGFDLSEGEEGFEALRQELLDHYLKSLSVHSRLYPGMDDVLSWAESREIPWGVVTNKPSLYAEPLLRDLELDARCASLICPDHVKQRKPHPEPILLACARIGVDARSAVYVGDHRRDIEAGKNAGCTTIACRYGYVHDSDPAESWGADYTVDKANELTALLETL
ncbi:phosphoglycolate phosphatase [Litorivivens lipolytica]|uniref:Phosphoglycolate phosphatase n=1 Tax=Litorivivens lipolytica TaxID=1524264 RepID=A0A7W4W3I9_9GAMM|nr:HAD family hydrolase [Litorivivens lipolytica]MBB3046781.1 phosphoglycolate phosphatase [Litorivivens lipolytica]